MFFVALFTVPKFKLVENITLILSNLSEDLPELLLPLLLSLLLFFYY